MQKQTAVIFKRLAEFWRFKPLFCRKVQKENDRGMKIISSTSAKICGPVYGKYYLNGKWNPIASPAPSPAAPADHPADQD